MSAICSATPAPPYIAVDLSINEKLVIFFPRNKRGMIQKLVALSQKVEVVSKPLEIISCTYLSPSTLAYVLHTLWIWKASSRAGARISAIGVSLCS